MIGLFGHEFTGTATPDGEGIHVTLTLVTGQDLANYTTVLKQSIASSRTARPFALTVDGETMADMRITETENVRLAGSGEPATAHMWFAKVPTAVDVRPTQAEASA